MTSAKIENTPSMLLFHLYGENLTPLMSNGMAANPKIVQSGITDSDSIQSVLLDLAIYRQFGYF